jgi:hypothetical protein
MQARAWNFNLHVVGQVDADGMSIDAGQLSML